MTLLASALFFLSGFAALLYQVTWQRMLVIFSGADVYSATLIVTAFMGGLGVGSLAGGIVADRISPRSSLALFGAAELAIAVFGRYSASFYYDFLYQRLGHVDVGPAAMATVLFVSLLWPTLFMGASLPLIARALTHRLDRAPATIGMLYGINTLGAAAGAALSTWWLLPTLGLEGTAGVGSLLNTVCALVLLPLAFSMRKSPAGTNVPRATVAPAVDTAPAATNVTLPVWAAIVGLTGMLALSLEIVWFRLIGVMMKATAFTFGTMLALFLVGLGAGAFVGRVVARRTRRPAVTFLTLQSAASLCAGGLVILVVRSVDSVAPMWTYLGSYEAMSVREQVTRLIGAISDPANATFPLMFLGLYVALPGMLILPSTVLMGCAFPVLQRIVQTDLHRVGRRVGGLLLANVIGSMIGTAVTGWLLLDRFGTAGTLRLLTLMSVVFAVLALVLARPHHGTRAGAT